MYKAWEGKNETGLSFLFNLALPAVHHFCQLWSEKQEKSVVSSCWCDRAYHFRRCHQFSFDTIASLPFPSILALQLNDKRTEGTTCSFLLWLNNNREEDGINVLMHFHPGITAWSSELSCVFTFPLTVNQSRRFFWWRHQGWGSVKVDKSAASENAEILLYLLLTFKLLRSY